MKTSILTEKLKNNLNCNNKSLSILLGVSQDELLIDNGKSWIEIENCTLGRTISSLLFVIDELKQKYDLDPILINKILLTARHQLSDGNIVDVVTAIRIGLSNDVLLDIAESALKYNDHKKLPTVKE